MRPISALAVSAALLVAGCGSSHSTPPPQQQAPVGTATSTTIAAPTDAGETAGSLGDASSAQAGGGRETVRPGGKLDPAAVLSDATAQDGVGAAKGCVGTDALPADTTSSQNAAAVLCLLNAQRSTKGLPPLSQNAALGKAAKAYAATMVAKRFFGHVSPSGSTMVTRLKSAGYLTGVWSVGENLAWGSGELATPRAIVAAWMNSPGHRANILTANFKQIGLALADGTPKGDNLGATYVTEFGTHGTGGIASRAKIRRR